MLAHTFTHTFSLHTPVPHLSLQQGPRHQTAQRHQRALLAAPLV